MSQKQGSSKTPRAAMHAGRARGSNVKTGNRGAKGGRPPELLLITMNKGLGHKAKRKK